MVNSRSMRLRTYAPSPRATSVMTSVGLAEIFAADRLVERVTRGTNSGNARTRNFQGQCLDLYESRQQRGRKRGVAPLAGGAEPVRQLALARESAVPFTLVVGDAADLPQRQLQLHQCQRSIGPGFCFDQARDARSALALPERREVPAGVIDDPEHQWSRHRVRVAQAFAE